MCAKSVESQMTLSGHLLLRWLLLHGKMECGVQFMAEIS